MTITADQIDFSRSVPVISSAQKFIIPIPAMAASESDPLVYPNGNSKAGQPIAGWDGKPAGDRGVVFFNDKDKTVQAVPANGKGVIIIDQVNASQAADLDSYRSGLPKNLAACDVKELLQYAGSGLGLKDMYNSTTQFVGSEMTAVASTPGLFKRDSRDICQAVRLTGSGEFQGPAATPQKYENGAIIVRQGDSVRLIQPEVAVETYTSPDGKKLELGKVPVASLANRMDLRGMDQKQLHAGTVPEGTAAMKRPDGQLPKVHAGILQHAKAGNRMAGRA